MGLNTTFSIAEPVLFAILVAVSQAGLLNKFLMETVLLGDWVILQVIFRNIVLFTSMASNKSFYP